MIINGLLIFNKYAIEKWELNKYLVLYLFINYKQVSKVFIL